MRVLIIGLGSIAQKHIKAIKELYSNVTLYALRSTVNVGEQKGIINIFSIDKINKLSIDFVIISNPTALHRDTIESLIPLNLPLFIEKPLFSDLNNDKIIREIHNKGITTYVACNLRFLGCLRFIRDYIIDKRINEVNIYCGSYLPDWRPNKDYKTTYSANKELGGGVHIDLIHEIDYAYWLFGRPLGVHKKFSNKSSLGINAYDYANYILSFNKFNVSIILNYFRRDSKRTLEIILDEETILVDLLKNCVYRDNDIIFESNKTIADTYKDQMSFFLQDVISQKREFNKVEEAYEILKICLQND